jgi:hypothetical protein
MMRVDRVLWRIRDMSRIVTSFVMLRKKNPRLLLIMLGKIPKHIFPYSVVLSHFYLI